MKLHKLSIVIAALALLVLSSICAQGATFWVAPNGTDAVGGNFGTEANPFRTIQYAINYSYQFGTDDTVIVKPGSYKEHITIAGAGSLLLRSQSGPAITTIDGDLTGICVQFSMDNGYLTIDGFTITRGVPYGIYVPSNYFSEIGNPEIRNCNIFQNGLSTSVSSGAGIRLEYGRPFIHDNAIKENWTQGSGAGISGINASPDIRNNVIDSNWSSQSLGAGIYLLSSFQDTIPASVQNNLIRWNRSRLDGANLYLDGNAKARILNNLFYKGEIDSGFNGQGGGMAYLPSCRPVIFNNIFMGNESHPIDCNGTSLDSTYYNCFYQNTPDNLIVGACNLNSSNLVDVDPLFVNESARNYHLRSVSPLVDAGLYLNGMAFSDFEGASRWIGVNPDIGPFENCKLIPDFTLTPDTPCVATNIFTDFAISGSWYRTIWEWGDGKIDTVFITEEFAPVKSYAQPGVYNIKMTASCESDTQSVTKTITVLGKPDPQFVASDTSICVGTAVTFTNNTTSAAVTYLWQFGDGNTSTETSPTHTFATTGARLIRLIATNKCGVDTLTLNATVIDKPNASFTANPQNGSAPLLVNFNGSANNPATSWLWSFGAGGGAQREDTNYTYEAPGLYTVELTAANDCGTGVKATQTNYIRVSGFALSLVSADTVSNNFRKVYTVKADSIFGPYSRRVNLSASVIPANPRRGRVTATLDKSQIAIPEQFTVTVTMDSVLAAGDYQLRVLATSTANLPVDTMLFHFRSNPYAIASVAPLTIDYDSVQIDETATDTVLVRNQLQFPLLLTVTVQNVVSSDPAFVPLVTSSTQILPGGFQKIPVRFQPDAVGPYEASLQIQTNDPVTETFQINLTGIGIPERKPPYVIATFPAAGAGKVLVGTQIYLDVSEILNGNTFTPVPLTMRSKRLNQPLTGTFGASNSNTRLSLEPTFKLPPYDTIEVTLSGLVRDLADNTLDGDRDSIGEGSPIDDYKFTFSTGPAVFPGDCNNDGRVNEMDILPLGVFFDLAGPRRDQFGEGNSFAAKQALEWDDPRATFADANGDGLIDVADILVISTNWDLTHASPAPLKYDDLNLPDFAQNFLQLRPALSSFAGTDRGDKMLDIINSLAADVVVPDEFALLQNFPNPFNPQTRIGYALPVGAAVRVTIHNILGQTVRTLVDAYEAPGFKNVVWDGADESGRQVSTGLYFYRLEAGSFVSVRKMMKLQ